MTKKKNPALERMREASERLYEEEKERLKEIDPKDFVAASRAVLKALNVPTPSHATDELSLSIHDYFNASSVDTRKQQLENVLKEASYVLNEHLENQHPTLHAPDEFDIDLDKALSDPTSKDGEIFNRGVEITREIGRSVKKWHEDADRTALAAVLETHRPVPKISH